MIPMSELLKDPTYKKYLLRIPQVPAASQLPHLSPMWVVYVKPEVEGKWRRKSFRKYSKAFKFFKKAMALGVADACINNKRLAFDPPARLARIRGKFVVGSDGVKRQATKRVEWKPRLSGDDPDHEWCLYCRRPVEFKYYSKHPALKAHESMWDIPLDSSVRRCCICGASERIAVPWQRRRW